MERERGREEDQHLEKSPESCSQYSVAEDKQVRSYKLPLDSGNDTTNLLIGVQL